MKKIKLDVRTKFIIILFSSIVVFALYSSVLETALVLLITFLHIMSVKNLKAMKLFTIYMLFLVLQYTLLPVLNGTLAMMLNIFVVVFRRLFPCVMGGRLLLSTTTVSELLSGLQRMKVPRKLTVPLAVTLRYIPAIKEECGHIHDAMLLRKVKKNKNIFLRITNLVESYYVPLLVSAAEMSEELSAAAITRGIENPGKRTVLYPTHFKGVDYLVMLLLVLLVAVALCEKYAWKGILLW